MGYYTKFELDIAGETDEMIDEISSMDHYGIKGAWKKNMDTIKWYEHETEMKEFSKKYPKALFTLHGEGEESGDIWIKYFRNGKMQRANAVITFEQFDPGKLE